MKSFVIIKLLCMVAILCQIVISMTYAQVDTSLSPEALLDKGKQSLYDHNFEDAKKQFSVYRNRILSLRNKNDKYKQDKLVHLAEIYFEWIEFLLEEGQMEKLNDVKENASFVVAEYGEFLELAQKSKLNPELIQKEVDIIIALLKKQYESAKSNCDDFRINGGDANKYYAKTYFEWAEQEKNSANIKEAIEKAKSAMNTFYSRHLTSNQKLKCALIGFEMPLTYEHELTNILNDNLEQGDLLNLLTAKYHFRKMEFSLCGFYLDKLKGKDDNEENLISILKVITLAHKIKNDDSFDVLSYDTDTLVNDIVEWKERSPENKMASWLLGWIVLYSAEKNQYHEEKISNLIQVLGEIAEDNSVINDIGSEGIDLSGLKDQLKSWLTIESAQLNIFSVFGSVNDEFINQKLSSKVHYDKNTIKSLKEQVSKALDFIIERHKDLLVFDKEAPTITIMGKEIIDNQPIINPIGTGNPWVNVILEIDDKSDIKEISYFISYFEGKTDDNGNNVYKRKELGRYQFNQDDRERSNLKICQFPFTIQDNTRKTKYRAEVVAEDIHKNISEIKEEATFDFTYTPEPNQELRFAFVIGNEKYMDVNDNLNNLIDNDVVPMLDYLTRYGKFNRKNICVLIDQLPTKDSDFDITSYSVESTCSEEIDISTNVIKALKYDGGGKPKLPVGSEVFFYYSGHGMITETTSDDIYGKTNTKRTPLLRLKHSTFDLNELIGAAKDAPTVIRFSFLLDGCFSGEAVKKVEEISGEKECYMIATNSGKTEAIRTDDISWITEGFVNSIEYEDYKYADTPKGGRDLVDGKISTVDAYESLLKYLYQERKLDKPEELVGLGDPPKGGLEQIIAFLPKNKVLNLTLDHLIKNSKDTEKKEKLENIEKSLDIKVVSETLMDLARGNINKEYAESFLLEGDKMGFSVINDFSIEDYIVEPTEE